jgi:tetratricopeptide (TPR) repeat protein
LVRHSLITPNSKPVSSFNKPPKTMKLNLFSKSLLIICLIHFSVSAQLTIPADGGNAKATVSEFIGLTEIKLTYNRPGVKGREGKVFGTSIAHYGFVDQHFGFSKSAPWRAGANENTTINVNKDVKIEGKTLPAGKYGLFMALSENETTIIFSKNSDSWGSFYYNPKEDVLQVTVKQLKDQLLVERLKFEFSDQTESSAVLSLLWEKWKIPMKIEVDLVNDQLNTFRDELRTDKGFTHLAFVQAANYCLDKNVNLEEGLFWADKAISEAYIGTTNFATLSLKSRFLEKLGKAEEAKELMKKALPLGSTMELHLYGRQLLQAKKNNEALEVFKLNESKYPNDYLPKMGMARALSALGKYQDALKYARTALALSVDNSPEKLKLEEMITKLLQGKDVN